MPPVPTPPKKENLFLNLICNIAIPTVVLMKFSKDEWLGPICGLVVALSFPVAYGLYDLAVRRKTNFFSVLGFVSVLLSGGLGLLKLDAMWFAVKEAAMPLAIGAVVLLSTKSKRPMVRELLFNEQIVDVKRVNAALEEKGRRPDFERLLRNASLWLALAFVFIALLNFVLARIVLKSPPSTPAFNEELGRMQLLSWPVITIPGMAAIITVFWRLISKLSVVTGLSADEIFHAEKKP